MKNVSWLFFVLTLIVSLPATAQNKWVEKGDKLMKKYRFEKAAKLYKKAADADVTNIPAREKLAQALMVQEDYASAEAVYASLVANPAAAPINKYNYAQALVANGKYEEAGKIFKQYAEENPAEDRAAIYKNYGEEIKPLTEDRKMYDLISAPENSSASELSAAYLNGNIVITSNRSSASSVAHTDFWGGKNYYDIFTLGTSDSFTAEPQKIKGKINKRLNEGPCTFSADGKEMIFTRSNYKKKGPGGVRMLGLYHADYDEKKGWVNVQPLPFNSTDYNVAHASLSPDGNRLYFVSDMPGGSGGTDIYVSVKEGNVWGQATNLGKGVNTPGQEMFPFIAADGTLYFASDSRVGLGGFDNYSARLVNNKWGNVVNMGAPINTLYDDFGYITDEKGRDGYMVSNRPGGMGGDDIYKFHRRAEVICGTIVHAKSNEYLEGVKVTAANSNGETVSAVTDANGNFCFSLVPGFNYKVTTDKDGFFAYEGAYEVRTQRNARLNLQLKPKGGIDLVVDVTDKGSSELEGATVYLVNKQTGEVEEQKSDADGKARFDLFPDQQYDVKVIKSTGNRDGAYERFVKTISTMGFKPADKVLEEAKLDYYEGKYVFDLPNVYFEYGSHTIRPFAKKELDKVAEVMGKFFDMEVELSSHTDSRGSAAYNLGLSALRAQACVLYLQSKGVDQKRLIAIGYGEERLKNKCKDGVECTEKQHAANRRTEFRVVTFE